MDGALTYTLFYVSFVLILFTLTSFIPVEAIDGITQEQIDQLTTPIEIPDDPGIGDYLFYPFALIGSFFGNIVTILSVSSSYQFLALLLSIFTVGMGLVIISFIRGN